MTTYYVLENRYGTTIVRVQDEVVSFIPDDSANPDWRAYQEWIAEGNTPEPYVPTE